MSRNLTYDAIGAGLGGFVDTATKMISFAGDMEDRKLRREQLASQERRQIAQDERQARLDEETRRRQGIQDERSGQEFQWKQEDRRTAAEKLEQERADKAKEAEQAKLARDVFVAGTIMKMDPGENVTPDWMPVLNRAFPEYPDFKTVKRTETGVEIDLTGEVIDPTGRKTTKLIIPTDKLEDMFNSQFSALDEKGLGFYKKYAESFGIDAVSPTQRAAAYSNLIEIKRRMAAEETDPKTQDKLWDEIKNLSSEYENILGIKSASPAGVMTPAQENAQKTYESEYKKFSSGSGWGKFVNGIGGTNDRGIDPKEQQRLDEIWTLTGQPRAAAPHRSGVIPDKPPAAAEPVKKAPASPKLTGREQAFNEPAPAQPAAPAGVPTGPVVAAQPAPAPAPAAVPDGMVRMKSPSGKVVLIPKANAAKAQQSGFVVVQ